MTPNENPTTNSLEALKRNKVIIIITTIVLGAIGSGLWELLFKHAFTLISNALINLLSFGSSAIMNSIFTEVARGHNDRAASTLLFWGFLGITIYYMNAIMSVAYKPKIDPEIENLKTKSKAEQQILIPQLQAKLDRSRRKTRLAVWILSCFVLAFCAARYLITDYECSAVENLEQHYTVCLPFISQTDRDSLRSQFALIKSRPDYNKVLLQLGNIESAHGINLRK